MKIRRNYFKTWLKHCSNFNATIEYTVSKRSFPSPCLSLLLRAGNGYYCKLQTIDWLIFFFFICDKILLNVCCLCEVCVKCESRMVLWEKGISCIYTMNGMRITANIHISFNNGKFYSKTCDYLQWNYMVFKILKLECLFHFHLFELRLRHFEVFAA